MNDTEIAERFMQIMNDKEMDVLTRHEKLTILAAEVREHQLELENMNFDECEGGACKL